MKVTALITTLVLSTSSIAMARPVVSFEATGGWSTETDIRDHRSTRYVAPVSTVDAHASVAFAGKRGRDSWRYDRQPTYPAYQPPIVSLARSLRFDGADTKTIYVGAEAGNFGKLRIEAASGRPQIQQVWVQFADGQEGAFHNLNVTLQRGGQPLELDLVAARPIRKIVIYAPGYGMAKTNLNSNYADRGREGAFSVLAI